MVSPYIAKTDAPFTAPVTFADPVATARALCETLRTREKVDLVVCLSHSGTSTDPKRSEDETLAREVPQIDVIVSGHTHNAMVELLKVDQGVEKYYINSGTFRNVITSTPTMGDFGRLRSKARVLIFTRGEENPEYTRQTGWSFDFINRFGFGSTWD